MSRQAPEKELNKWEISNPSDAGFKTLVKEMLKELSEDLSSIKKGPIRTSGQDGGVGGHTVPPHTTKRRATNLKIRNHQN